MATYNAPTWLRLAQLEWGIQKAGVQFAGPFNGTMQAVDFLAERWVVSITLPPVARADSGAVEAFFNLLAGGVNRVRLAHMGSGTMTAPGTPRGTLRGTPTLSAAATRGATSLAITTTAGATLLAGDMIGCNQLFQVAADATADGAGAMTVNLVNRVRAATGSGTAIVWNRPAAEFFMPAMSARHVHVPAVLMGGQFDLVEWF